MKAEVSLQVERLSALQCVGELSRPALHSTGVGWESTVCSPEFGLEGQL